MKKWLSGWGCYPKIYAQENAPHSLSSWQSLLACASSTPWIARGLGKSYGDSALAEHIYSSQYFKYFIDFDPTAGILSCQSGVSLAEILTLIVPHGWFLPVTPGTKWISLGGAIASDVHGKNHHHVGTFSAFIEELELLTAEGMLITCSTTNNPSIFYATCGGMGLTGFIVSARLRLRKIDSQHMQQQLIKTKTLDETLETLHANHDAEYSVAWLDCTAAEKNLGRALVLLGQHTQTDEKISYLYNKTKNNSRLLRYAAPCLNAYSIKLFNTLYYHLHKKNTDTVSLNQYFYPLDGIAHWNDLYGTGGFTQYQFVLPYTAHETLKKILLSIRAFGACSFLSVLKTLGKENGHYLSFPMPGFTLAIDFKISEKLWRFLDQLDQQIIDVGGRVYLTKDCRLPSKHFQKMYPRWQEFLAIKAAVDPHNKIQSLQSQRIFSY
jgi:decaprenylphospho-beta-D-ribofuranose 2-oxidase